MKIDLPEFFLSLNNGYLRQFVLLRSIPSFCGSFLAVKSRQETSFPSQSPGILGYGQFGSKSKRRPKAMWTITIKRLNKE
jgi:hypothetical protein